MNILFVYGTPFHPERGGIERVSDLLARELSKRGHVIKYLHNRMPNDFPAYDYPVKPDFFPDPEYYPKVNFEFYKRYLISNDIDVIINQGGLWPGYSKLYNCTDGTNAKVISVIHGTPDLAYSRLFNEILYLRNKSVLERIKRLGRIALFWKIKRDYYNRIKSHYEWLCSKKENNCDCIVLLSSYHKERVLELGGNPQANVHIIGNPISFKIEKNLSKQKTVLFVGRLEIGNKRPDRLIKIWKHIAANYPDWTLKILGDGPEKQMLKNLAQSCDSIKFCGFQNPEPYFREASILCMTSDHEGFPMVLMEGMSKGCIPMAFGSFLAIKDILKDERQVVKPFSLKEYEQKLTAIMDDQSLRQTLSEKGFQIASQYTLDSITEKWIDLFKTLKI